jgi:uncharacterized protein (DUF427 family)
VNRIVHLPDNSLHRRVRNQRIFSLVVSVVAGRIERFSMSENGRTRIEPSPKRVRAMIGGEVVVDSANALMVWEIPYYPTYYFPEVDVRMDALVETGDTKNSPSRGVATLYQVKIGDREGEAYGYRDPNIEDLAGHVALRWSSMDHWFEEDEEVFVHPRDPYTRVDILPSSRRVRVEIDGVTVADTTNASFLFETNLPTRYYIPKTDVAMDLLTPTDLATHCPYKGQARYWNVDIDGTIHENVAWGYDAPLPESQRILGLVSFYNEKLDIYVDEVLQARPRTKFS